MLKEFTELDSREGEGAQGVKRFGGFTPLEDNGEACMESHPAGCHVPPPKWPWAR